MTRYIHRISGLDLRPGNKSAGFVLSVDAAALYQLSLLAVTAEEQDAVCERALKRAARGKLGNKVLRSGMAIHFHGSTPVPRFFSALSGSVGADPEAFPRLSKPGFVSRFGPDIEYTPHNVDSQVEALLLMMLVQTWSEWAVDLLFMYADKLDELPPALEALPSYGNLIPAGEFEDHVSGGGINPDDGSGRWATSVGMSDVSCFEKQPAWATHVMWLNR